MSDLRNDFEAPYVLADRCFGFVGDPDEPGICSDLRWLHDEHPESRPLRSPGVAPGTRRPQVPLPPPVL